MKASFAPELAAALLELGAVKLAPQHPFTWSSGLKAPIYCDNRRLMGQPEWRSRIVTALTHRGKEFQPTLIAGTATAGVPWATLVADRLNLPLAYVRPVPKKHGTGRQVEGSNVEGHAVLLIEDLISTGGSSLKCAEALRKEGARVVEVLALFSYGLPQAVQAFSEAQVPFTSLSTFEILSEEAERRGTLDATGKSVLKTWQRDAMAWSREHGGA